MFTATIKRAFIYCNLTPVLIVGYRFCCNYLYVLLVINKLKKKTLIKGGGEQRGKEYFSNNCR